MMKDKVGGEVGARITSFYRTDPTDPAESVWSDPPGCFGVVERKYKYKW